MPPAVEARSLNHWSAREVPTYIFNVCRALTVVLLDTKDSIFSVKLLGQQPHPTPLGGSTDPPPPPAPTPPCPHACSPEHSLGPTPQTEGAPSALPWSAAVWN